MFNNIPANSSFGRQAGGQECAFQHGGQYKSYFFAENQSAIKYLP